jgi:homoserine kinase type II
LLKEVPKVLNKVSDLTTQVIHNDYGGPNLMFKGAELAAVIDFNPPTPFLISYEIGRVALPPENLCLSDWREKAVVLIKEYCGANKVNLKDISLAPHMWFVQLIRSTYGVKQHYIDPLELQSELDNFWFRRAYAAEQILKDIKSLEKSFEDAWRKTGLAHGVGSI